MKNRKRKNKWDREVKREMIRIKNLYRGAHDVATQRSCACYRDRVIDELKSWLMPICDTLLVTRTTDPIRKCGIRFEPYL